MQDCGNSSVLAMLLLQSGAKPPIRTILDLWEYPCTTYVLFVNT